MTYKDVMNAGNKQTTRGQTLRPGGQEGEAHWTNTAGARQAQQGVRLEGDEVSAQLSHFGISFGEDHSHWRDSRLDPHLRNKLCSLIKTHRLCHQTTSKCS